MTMSSVEGLAITRTLLRLGPATIDHIYTRFFYILKDGVVS